jgi:aminopeptidase
VQSHDERARRLAELIVGVGANVQPGQLVAINTFTGMESTSRELARAAYARGARWVDVLTWDLWVKRARIELAPAESLDFVPQWLIDRLDWLSEECGARISLSGPSQPEALRGVDPARAGRDLLPYLPNTGKVVNAGTMNWCVAPVPTVEWARLVYPDLDPEQALEELWAAIWHMCRLDAEDPAATWQARGAELVDACGRLNAARFDAIRLHGSGTDLTVGLLPSSRWVGGRQETAWGLPFLANLPTEEVFTTPDPQRVDGTVTATRPLELHGSIVEGIRVEFATGRATRIDADTHAEVLRTAAAKDDGASRLGELALVDDSGRVGSLERVFYTTLIDENAASHIALGNGYTRCVADRAEADRVNQSTVHIDFMIGSPELHVDGITQAGESVAVLREGRWQL